MQRVSPERSSLAVATTGAPKLLDRVRQTIRAKHYSRRTERAYVDWIRRYIVFHRKRHPSDVGASEIAAFLTWLATERRVSASTRNQALSTVLFLYRKYPHRRSGPWPFVFPASRVCRDPRWPPTRFHFRNPSCRRPSHRRRGRPALRSVSAYTRHSFATPDRAGTTFEPCRSCSGTRTSVRR